MTDCAICQTTISTEAYKKCDEDTEIDSFVFRLKCGHAFHTTCLCRSLRQDTTCPSCRQGSIDYSVDDADVAETIVDIDFARRVVVMLDISNKIPAVQKARQKFNNAKRDYRAFEKTLIQERRLRIKDALARFRHDHRSEFEAKRRRLNYAMKDLQTAEISVASQHLNADDLRRVQESGQYDAKNHVDNQNQFGPYKRKFWDV